MGDGEKMRAYTRMQRAAYRAGLEDAAAMVRAALIAWPVDETEHAVNSALETVCHQIASSRERGIRNLGSEHLVPLEDFPFPAGSWVTTSHSGIPSYVTSLTGDDGQTRYAYLRCCPIRDHPYSYGWAPMRGAKGSVPLEDFKACTPPERFLCGRTMRDYQDAENEAHSAAVGRAARQKTAEIIEAERG